MTGPRSRPAATLRSRLAVAVTALTVLPLLIGSVLLLRVAPGHARAAALTVAARDADAASVALSGRCDAVRADTRVAAGEVAAFATRSAGAVTEDAAQAFAERAVARQPGSAVAVFGADGQLLAGAGTGAARVFVVSIGAQSLETGPSCSAGRAVSTGEVAGLAELSPVLINLPGSTATTQVATVVTWLPVDTVALDVLGERLGSTGLLGVLPASGQPVLMAAGGDSVRDQETTALLRDLPTEGAAQGARDGLAYRVVGAGPGLPYRVLAVEPPAGTWWWPLGWALLGLALSALALLWFVLTRLTRPVAEELSAAGERVEAGRLALADSLDRFGEVLVHTHDLDELLVSVTGTALSGTEACAARILLMSDEVDPPDLPAGDPRAPDGRRGSDQNAGRRRDGGRVSVSTGTGGPGPAGERAQAALSDVAERHFAGFTVTSQEAQPPGEPQLIDVPGAGPVAAIGIGVDAAPEESPAERGPGLRRVIGVLVVARGEGGAAFDALALTRLRALAEQTGAAVTNIRRYLEVRRLSMTDTLTGLGNRAQLVSSLSREIAAAARGDGVLTVLMLDIDHFKAVNDTWGHSFGDVVLRDFAARLLACVREADTVTRYGGEEFVVLLRDTDADGGCRVAQRVLDAAGSRPFTDGAVSQAVTVSIGVAAYPRDGRSADHVLQAADSALYAAKRDGRNRWRVAEPSHNAPIVPLPG